MVSTAGYTKTDGGRYYYSGFYAGDFTISENVLYFDSSASVGNTSCALFETVNDNIVEGTELFTFQALARNSLDLFADGDRISLSVVDDDGKRIDIYIKGCSATRQNIALRNNSWMVM